MTEPTAEQVDAERERAHEIMAFFKYNCGSEAHGLHMPICAGVATALARVRIEAHTAGRDEGLREAEDRFVPGSPPWLAVRELRGRT